MTTPRVTVPVEPIQRLILAADSYGVRYLDSDDMSAEAEELQAATEAMKDLIAAPAPEGGAVWFGVTGAVDETEALAVALFAVRCPGVRMTDEDLHYYRAAAQRAMRAVADELDTPALATRKEAPAEAGEMEWRVDYNAVVGVSAYLQNQRLFDSAKAVERMLSRAAAYRNCRDAHAELAALRAQPQAPADDDRLTADQAWADLLDKDDRTSPEDRPEMCLITAGELADYMARALPPAREDAQPVASLRPVVLAFAHLMEAKLKENDWKSGWKGDSAASLMTRLREETDELAEAVAGPWTENISWKRLAANEAADVANFAMMVADVCGGLPDSAVRSIAESTTRPAPDALRVAVEALEAAKALAMKYAPLSVSPKIIKALAALQAEQKGGA